MGCASSQTNHPTGEESRANGCGKPEISVPLPSASFPVHRAAGSSHSRETLHNGNLLPTMLPVPLDGHGLCPQGMGQPWQCPCASDSQHTCTPGPTCQPCPCGITSQQEEAAKCFPGAWMICLPYFVCLRLPGDTQPQPPPQGRAGSLSQLRAPNSLFCILAGKVGKDQDKAPQP